MDEVALAATLKHGGLYKRLGQSLIPHREVRLNRKLLAAHLSEELLSGRYFPSVPRGYLVLPKSETTVPRITVVLSDADSCVYYHCVRAIESVIAVNRIAGTFGGWAMGNSVRSQEASEVEAKRAKVSTVHLPGPYGPTNSVNVPRWSENWSEFTMLLHERAQDGRFTCFIKFDIANFYDTIRLDRLEKRIRAHSTGSAGSYIDLLFLLLSQWNRQFEGFHPKSVGIPQEEIGDASRLLANFYLQDYDRLIHHQCQDLTREGIATEYFRFADDQVIMTSDPTVARSLLFYAGVELHKIGLNINSGKVMEFHSKEDFGYYWNFDYLDLLDDKEDIASVRQAAFKFLEQIANDKVTVNSRSWRRETVLRRLVSIGVDNIEQPMRSQLVELALSPMSVPFLSHWMLTRLFPALTEAERRELFEKIDEAIEQVPFNGFLLNVRRFYSHATIGKSTSRIDERLLDVQVF